MKTPALGRTKSKLTKAERERRRRIVELTGQWRVLAIDPAGMTKKEDRGFAYFYKGDLAEWTNDLAEALEWGSFDVAVCENQWANPKSSRQSLITLGQGAGFLLGEARAALKLMVPVYDWKNAIIPGFANAEKAMYTKNLAQMWPDVSNPHCLDAVGLGAAFVRGSFSTEQLIEWVFD